jgi:cytochrome P450 family 9
MRSTLSPAFTGSKMRLMLNFVQKCASSSIVSAKKDIEESGVDVFEMKELFSKFAIDVIASCAFGLEVDSFKNPENDFKKVANSTMNPNGPLVAVKFFFLYFVPKVMKLLDISLLERHTKNFFRKTVNETMEYREKHDIVRPDMIHLLMQTKKGKLTREVAEDTKETDSFAAVEELDLGKSEVSNWTNDELVAQCLLFFLAGFDTTSTTLAFASYELALNPEIQERLREEILDVKNSLDGKEVSYEALLKMKYLDQFVTEVLRKWSPAPGTERYCMKDFTFEVDGKSVTIEKEQSILIPVAAWHRDPQYFPNPEKFDPDRFNPENIDQQNLSAYAPFGIGARNCIGSRFALMTIKTILFNMLQSFSFEVTQKTQIPLKYKKTMMANAAAEKGVWLQIKNL